MKKILAVWLAAMIACLPAASALAEEDSGFFGNLFKDGSQALDALGEGFGDLMDGLGLGKPSDDAQDGSGGVLDSLKAGIGSITDSLGAWR